MRPHKNWLIFLAILAIAWQPILSLILVPLGVYLILKDKPKPKKRARKSSKPKLAEIPECLDMTDRQESIAIIRDRLYDLDDDENFEIVRQEIVEDLNAL